MGETRTVHVNVTADHIKHGVPCSYSHCPVGMALEDVVALVVDVRVEEDSVCFDGGEQIVPLPREVRDWLVEFDRKRRVAPFSFDLELPLEVISG